MEHLCVNFLCKPFLYCNFLIQNVYKLYTFIAFMGDNIVPTRNILFVGVYKKYTFCILL